MKVETNNHPTRYRRFQPRRPTHTSAADKRPKSALIAPLYYPYLRVIPLFSASKPLARVLRIRLGPQIAVHAIPAAPYPG